MSTNRCAGDPGRVVVRFVVAVALAMAFACLSPGLVHSAAAATGPNTSVAVTTNSNEMAATYGVAYLTDDQTVLVGANDFEADVSSAGPIDTGLQAAIVTGGSVKTVAVPLPSGATEATAFIDGAAVTALTNGNFAILYWGSNESDGSGGEGANGDLPNYYVQVFSPDGSTVGGLITLTNNGNNGNKIGTIAEDTANDGFVVVANTDDEEDIVVQRYTNAGATVGASLSFAGSNPYSTTVDSRGDILTQFTSATEAPEYLFIPDGATSATSTGVLPEQASPTSMAVAADPNGGFIGFELPGSGSDLEAQTISTGGALGSRITLGSVGSSIAKNDFIWSVVALSGGGYAMTLNPDSGNSVIGFPAVDQVITVGASLSAASTAVEDMTTSGGDPAPIGAYAVADGSGGIATYTDIPGAGKYSSAGFPLEASLSATTYLDVVRPTVSAGGTATFTAGGPAVVLDSTVGVTDPSGGSLSGATVGIGTGRLAGDHLSADTAGTSITASYAAGTGVLTLAGSDTLANYEAVLDSVTYSFEPSGGDATSGGTDTSRTIEWTVSDTTATSATVTSSLTLKRQQQSPLSVTSTGGTFGAPITLTTSGGSGTGALSFTATNGSATGCSVVGAELTVGSAGTCTVTATKAADNDHEAVSSAPTTVTFAKAAQAALTVTSTNGTDGAPLTLTASGGSGTGAVSFTATDGTATGCTVSGSSLSTTSAGTCTVTATKAGDGDFEPASSVGTTVTFAAQAQAALAVTSTSGTFGTSLELTTSGGSGAGAVSFSAIDGTATGCTVSGTELTVGSAGTCTVTATKAGDGDFEVVSSGPTIVTFAKATQQAVEVTSLSGVYETPLTLATRGGSGSGTVSFTATDGTATGCTVSGTTLTAGGAGTCIVTATKAGDVDFEGVSSNPTTVTLAKATQQALEVNSPGGTYGTPVTLTTSGGSGSGAVSFDATDGTATGCTVSGTELTAGSAGTCTVTATKAADDDHEAVSSSPTAVTFAKAVQSALAVTSTGGTFGTPLELTASGGSGSGAVSFTATDGTATGCTVSGTTLTAGGAGTCIVTATKAGDRDYEAVSSDPTTVTLAKPISQEVTPPTGPSTPTTPTTTMPPNTKPKPVKPKPEPAPEQHVTVEIRGVTDGATYFGTAPEPHCVAHTNTGHVACRITRSVTNSGNRTTVTYTAHAQGSAGATATARVTVHTAKLEFDGLHPTHGVYLVKLGKTYTLRVASRTKPLYVTAAVAPQPPAGTHDWFHRSGSEHGIPVWTLRLYLHTFLSGFPAWNLGIKIGDKTQVITIHT